MTLPLFRFFNEHDRYMSFFMFVNSLATRADAVRNNAAEVLLSVGGMEDHQAEKYRESLKNKDKVFNELKNFSDIQSRNLLLSSVNNFLCYFSESIQLAILKRPDLLKSGSTMRIDEMLTFKRRSELIAYLVDRQVNDLSYGGLARMEEYMRERLGIEAFSSEKSRSLMIIAIELRNIHTHNRGIVNDLFLSRVKHRSGFEFVRGERFHVGWDDFVRLMQNNINVACRIDKSLADKFKIGRKRFSTWKGQRGGTMQMDPNLDDG